MVVDQNVEVFGGGGVTVDARGRRLEDAPTCVWRSAEMPPEATAQPHCRFKRGEEARVSGGVVFRVSEKQHCGSSFAACATSPLASAYRYE